LKTKLELAERVLAISNRLIQVTREIFVRGGRNIEPLVEQQLECFAKIRTLVQRIEELLDSKKERELFAAASVRWSLAERYRNQKNRHARSTAHKHAHQDGTCS
jgi:hypothetical protein